MHDLTILAYVAHCTPIKQHTTKYYCAVGMWGCGMGSLQYGVMCRGIAEGLYVVFFHKRRRFFGVCRPPCTHCISRSQDVDHQTCRVLSWDEFSRRINASHLLCNIPACNPPWSSFPRCSVPPVIRADVRSSLPSLTLLLWPAHYAP